MDNELYNQIKATERDGNHISVNGPLTTFTAQDSHKVNDIHLEMKSQIHLNKSSSPYGTNYVLGPITASIDTTKDRGNQPSVDVKKTSGPGIGKQPMGARMPQQSDDRVGQVGLKNDVQDSVSNIGDNENDDFDDDDFDDDVSETQKSHNMM